MHVYDTGRLKENVTMATYVLIPGAGSDSWYWHLVDARSSERRPRGRRGGPAVRPTTPPASPEYADVVVDAIGDRADLIVVASRWAGSPRRSCATACPVDLLVLVAAMVPTPGRRR